MPATRGPSPASPSPSPPRPRPPPPPATPEPGTTPASPLSKRFPAPASPPSTGFWGCSSAFISDGGPRTFPAAAPWVSSGIGARGPDLGPPASAISVGPDASGSGSRGLGGTGFLSRAGFGGGGDFGRGSARFGSGFSTILGGVTGSTWGGVSDSGGGGGGGGSTATSSSAGTLGGATLVGSG